MTGKSACVGVLVLSLFGCGSDEAVPLPAQPTLAIVSLTPSEGEPWSAGDGTPPALVMPCDGRVAVGLETTNWTARAPGACGKTQLCGHSFVEASRDDMSVSTDAVWTPVLLEFGTETPSSWIGSARVEARLQLDDGSNYLAPDGTPISAALDVEFSAGACGASDG